MLKQYKIINEIAVNHNNNKFNFYYLHNTTYVYLFDVFRRVDVPSSQRKC